MEREKSHQFDIGLLNESPLVSFKPQAVETLWRMKMFLFYECSSAIDINHPDLTLELTGGERIVIEYSRLNLIFVGVTSS